MFFALIMAAASSIMMTLTHYATGTSIIYGSGYTTLGEWWKAGFAMSIINIAILLYWADFGGRCWAIGNLISITKLKFYKYSYIYTTCP